MKDGRDIYVGPEDTLTDVRKYLEQVPTLVRSVTLIFDRHTLLRNPTDWRNLHAFARNQGKDVLIISPDPQTRAMAKAAKFRVVDSFEASATSRPGTPPTHPARRGTLNRGKPAPPVQRTFHRHSAGERQEPPASRRAGESAAQPARPTPMSEKRPSQPLFTNHNSYTDEIITDQLGGTGSASPHTPQHESNIPYQQPYEYRLEDEPYIRPLSREELEEEPDMLVEDFHLTEGLRQAAREASRPPSSPLPDISVAPLPRSDEPIDLTLTPDSDDPFAFLDDAPSPSRAEQRAEVFVDNTDTGEIPISDVSEWPTEILDAEEVHEQADELSDSTPDEVIEVDPPARSWQAAFLNNNDDEVVPRVHGVVPRSSRSGYIRPHPSSELPERESPPAQPAYPASSARPSQPMQQGDAPRVSKSLQPSGGERASATASQASGGRAGTGSLGTKGGQTPQPMELSSAAQKAPSSPRSTSSSSTMRGKTTKVKPGQQPKAGQRVGTKVGGPATRARGRVAHKTPQASRSTILLVAILILILLLVALLGYFVPSASVTVTVTARDFSASNLKLLATTAKTTVQGGSRTGTVAAIQLAQTFPTSGQALMGTGTATGTVPIGTAKATGNLTFTNNGNKYLTIPTGTVVQTASGIQFVTTAQATANTTNSPVGNTVSIPIEAQQSGEVGNVPPQSITVIPTSSLNTIAQFNNVDVNTIKISVTNPDATSGGGAGTATVVTQNDLTRVENTLRAQLQGAVDSWIKQQVHDGDIAGTPTVTTRVVDAPPVNQMEQSGTFKMGLFLDVKLLVVRSLALQQAAQALLDSKLQATPAYRGQYEVVVTAQYPIQLSQVKKTSDTPTALTLTFNATGKIIPRLSVNQIRSLISTRSKSDAVSILQGLPGVQKVSIQLSPAFMPWLPWGQRIQVTFVPGTPPAMQPTTTPTPQATGTPKTK
jgi:uncharacterized SAM-binding protein YcdF (DUF218 family)